MFYDGVITAWDPFRWSHSVKYDDNEVEVQQPPHVTVPTSHHLQTLHTNACARALHSA